MAKGVCKIPDGWAVEDSVIVEYENGDRHEMPASQYISDGYEPPIDTLPPCSDKDKR